MLMPASEAHTQPMTAIAGKNHPYIIFASWDAESATWVAESADVPGLVSGADTLEELVAKLRGLVPEMLQLNGDETEKAAQDVTFEILARRFETAPMEPLD